MPTDSRDSSKDTETVAIPVHDAGVLETAGWTNAELIWEQIQEAAAERERANDYVEAGELWRGGLEIAADHLSAGDLRIAASTANVAVAERRKGDPSTAKRMFEEALELWDGGCAWIESLRPIARARSSTFHLRLESKHPGAYDERERARYREVSAEGRSVLVARRDRLRDEADRLERWRRERPAGFNDWRKLLGAVLLIASDRGVR